MRRLLLLSLMLAAPASAQPTAHAVPLSPISGGIGVQIDTRHWYIDFSVELMARSLRQRRIAISADYYMLSTGFADIGLELTFWELGFRRRATIIDGTELETERRGRTIMSGPVLRRSGPWHTQLTGAVLAGWYTNRYISAEETDRYSSSAPIAEDDSTIGGARFALTAPSIANRIAIGGSVRYFHLLGPHSAFVPESEWSGEISFDVRTLSRRKKAIFVGALVRFGPRGPGLVTDKTFGIRMKWKLR